MCAGRNNNPAELAGIDQKHLSELDSGNFSISQALDGRPAGAVARLSQENQGIAFIGPALGKVDNRFTLATKIGEANDKFASLDILIQSFSSFGADSEAIENICATDDMLRQHFARLSEVVGLRIDAETEMQNRWNRMLKLSEDIHEQGDVLRGMIRPGAPDRPLMV